MGTFMNLEGRRFGRLTVESRIGARDGHPLWRCRCDCGQICEKTSRNLKCRGHSCGCRMQERYAAQTVHGHAKSGAKKPSATYLSWESMLSRCYRETNKDFHRYGGRGITVCASWRTSFEAFLADMGERPAGKTLDRRNNAKGYSPDNCRWATAKEQSANRGPTRREHSA